MAALAPANGRGESEEEEGGIRPWAVEFGSRGQEETAVAGTGEREKRGGGGGGGGGDPT